MSPGDLPSGAATSAVVHPRNSGENSENPAKHQRILAFFEHEGQPSETQFDSEAEGLDEFESYDFDLDETDDFSHTDAELLEQLCLRFSTLEPSLLDHELLRLGLVVDQLDIKRLRNMGVLIPADVFNFKGEKLKMLTTRMVRT